MVNSSKLSVCLSQEMKSLSVVKTSTIVEPQSAFTGTFLMMFDSPFGPIELKQPSVVEEIKMFLKFVRLRLFVTWLIAAGIGASVFPITSLQLAAANSRKAIQWSLVLIMKSVGKKKAPKELVLILMLFWVTEYLHVIWGSNHSKVFRRRS